ncbi:MAG: hypothetical protein WD081_03975 [Gammaproteobacteria bacterium]
MASRLAVLLFTSTLIACGGGGSSTPTPPAPPPPPPDPYDPGEVQPTLASIQDRVFTPICTVCHAGSTAPNGLRLEAGVSHGMLVNVASVNESSVMRVLPGDPDNSYLIHKLEGTQNVGERMPLGGPYLDAAVIGAIREWIEDGAAASSPPPSSKVAGTWPVSGSHLLTPPAHVLVVFKRELDSALVGPDSVRLLKVDGVRALPVAGASIELTSPTTVRITMPHSQWTPGRYELQAMGLGPYRLLDKAGQPIDGNGDGYPGGDFAMQFTLADAR